MIIRAPIESWLEKNPVSESLVWRRDILAHFEELRQIARLSSQADAHASIDVVSTHRSKGMLLPVIRIRMPRAGLVVFGRNNLSNWAVTVQCEHELSHLDMTDLDWSDNTTPIYFEGFERGDIPVYPGPWIPGRHGFSFRLWERPFAVFLSKLFTAAGVHPSS